MYKKSIIPVICMAFAIPAITATPVIGQDTRLPTLNERLEDLREVLEERARERVSIEIERRTGVAIDEEERQRRINLYMEDDMKARWSRANSRCKGLKGRDRATCNHELNAEKRAWKDMQKGAHSPDYTDHSAGDPGMKNKGKGKGKGKNKNKNK